MIGSGNQLRDWGRPIECTFFRGFPVSFWISTLRITDFQVAFRPRKCAVVLHELHRRGRSVHWPKDDRFDDMGSQKIGSGEHGDRGSFV